jgi:ribose transport system substrate-binding protein/D-allose transport system substrate-binding protein
MRNKPARAAGLVGVAAAALVLAACSSGSSSAPASSAAAPAASAAGGSGKALADIKVAGVIKGLDNPFFGTIATGMQDAAAEYGIELVVEAAPGLNDETGQANKLDTLAGQGFDCFVVIPISSNNLTQGLGKISQAGTPIINIDSPVDAAGLEAAGGKITAFVGSDNTKAGEKGGAKLQEVVGDGKTIGLIAGLAGNVTSNERITGAQTGAAASTFEGPVNADWDTTKALDAAKAMLAKNPDISGFFAANDQMAQGIAQAVAQAGKDIKIMGVDGIEAVLQDIKAGKIYGTVSQYPYVMGKLGVEACIVAAQGGTVPAFVESPTVVITPDNVDKALADFPKPPEAYDDPYAAMIKK